MPPRDSAAGRGTLGDFLRSRRAALDPRGLGLPDDGRPRRVPGLRREELADLAHVSVDSVVRLEQGRAGRVSDPVLRALADALRLAPDERAYLAAVAGTSSGAWTRPAPERPEAAPHLRHLLATMAGAPAMVLRRGMDVLAWNDAAVALLTDFGALPPRERNLVRLTFLDPAFRALYVDWARAARSCVAVLRMEAGRRPDDPDLTALVAELADADADFRAWWTGHDVRGARRLRKTYRHPVAGTLELDVQRFTVDTHPDQLLVTYTAAPGTPSDERLGRLLGRAPGVPDGQT